MCIKRKTCKFTSNADMLGCYGTPCRIHNPNQEAQMLLYVECMASWFCAWVLWELCCVWDIKTVKATKLFLFLCERPCCTCMPTWHNLHISSWADKSCQADLLLREGRVTFDIHIRHTCLYSKTIFYGNERCDRMFG